MIIRTLLTTTSCPDKPGSHQDLLESKCWEIVLERGQHELETKKCPT